MVLSKKALIGGCFILRYKPLPQAEGKKKNFALVWGNVMKLRLDLEDTRPSAQSISRRSLMSQRFYIAHVVGQQNKGRQAHDVTKRTWGSAGARGK